MPENEYLMPDEKSIGKMNEEYAHARARKSYLEKGRRAVVLTAKGGKPPFDKDDLARCYYLECDMLVCLEALTEKARNPAQCKVISQVCAIKKRNADKILSLYRKTGGELTYSPQSPRTYVYGALLRDICYMQSGLLMRYGCLSKLKEILNSEYCAALQLINLSI